MHEHHYAEWIMALRERVRALEVWRDAQDRGSSRRRGWIALLPYAVRVLAWLIGTALLLAGHLSAETLRAIIAALPR